MSPLVVASSSFDAEAATATFGNTTVGSSSDQPGEGYKFGSVFSLTQPGTTVSFSWYARGGDAPQRYTPVVYRVNPQGHPNTFVVKGAEVVIAANQPAGWVTSTLPSTSLAAGSYLLGLLSGPGGTKAHIHYTPAANRGFWNPNPYPTAPANWGEIRQDDNLWSAYVTYTPGTTTPPPTNTSAPTITGTAQQGHTLNASTGTWSGSPTGYAYQWQRCQNGTCTNVPSATGNYYPVTGSDVGYSLVVVVTATNAGGSTSATSSPTATVTAPPSPPANSDPPTISGNPQTGSTLSATYGSWTGHPSPTLSGQWQSCQGGTCTNIAGATGTTYAVREADLGKTLRIVVTATNSSGTSQATSAQTATVTSPPQSSGGSFGNTTPGTQQSTPGEGYKFGSVHTLNAGATLTALKWYARGGSANQSFKALVYNASAQGTPTSLVAQSQPVTVVKSQAAGWVTAPLPQGVTVQPGRYMLALLSGPSGQGAFIYYDNGPSDAAWWNANPYSTPSQTWGALNNSTQRWSFYAEYGTSAPTGPPVNQTAPTISGSPVVGQTLSASTGSWTNNPTSYAYQWQRCQGTTCGPITGATAATYLVNANDEGYTLKVTVTAANGSGSGQATSATTNPVTAPSGSTPVPFTKITIDPNPIGSVIEKAFADLNGDGRLDAVIGMQESPTQGGSGGIYWYQFPASGNPRDPWIKRTILPTGTAYEDMLAFDVDGDGRKDVVASVNTRVYWFRNPGPSGSWQQNLIGAGHGENNMSIGDLDGDGRMDLATNSLIFFQNSPTSWTRIQYNDTYNGVDLLDIGSGRGAINLVGNQPNPPYNIVWFENPRERGGNARTGTWTMRTIGPGYACPGGASTCATVAAVTTADLNRDGRMDVVVGQAEGDPAPTGGLKWYAAPVDRTQPWAGRDVNAQFESTHNIRLGDIDGNGTLDVVTGEQDQSPQKRVAVFYNDGNGNFTVQVLSNDGTHNVAVGDLEGDGDVDFIAGMHGWWGGPHAVELYLNGRF